MQSHHCVTALPSFDSITVYVDVHEFGCSRAATFRAVANVIGVNKQNSENFVFTREKSPNFYFQLNNFWPDDFEQGG